MEKGIGYTTKGVAEEGSVEFFATMHLQAKESLFILKALRNWMQRLERNPTSHAKNMVALWSRKADDLFMNVPHENSIEPKPFKSLMQQLAEGELSYKKEEHECAA